MDISRAESDTAAEVVIHEIFQPLGHPLVKKNEVLADRMKFFKETEEGQRELSGIELTIDARARVEGKMEMAAKLIQLGQMSLEMIAEISGLPIEELRKIQRGFNLA